jgi:D-glycero-D-manno-heptose 1,7-bisphosphate phosphatase
VVTNQPDVARGAQDLRTVHAIHERLRAVLPLDDFFICDHDDSDACACRKPRPGLLLRAAARHGVSLARSYMIGDRWRDVDAGAAAGCKTVWIDLGYRERAPESAPAARVASLAEAVESILRDLDG